MFYFGSPEATLELYLDNAFSLNGPELPSRHFEALSSIQQKALFAYIYIAYKDALEDGLQGEDLEAIVKLYDETFLKLARVSSEFREAVKNNRHQFLPDYSEEVRRKYLTMVDD